MGSTAAAADDGQDTLYECLLDSGVLDDVRSVAESIVDGSSSSSSSGSGTATAVADDGDNDDEDAEARRIADRLLERNADAVERALDEIAHDAKLVAAGVSAGRPVDLRWPLLPSGGRDARRTLDALIRWPFAGGTYTGPHFRKLTRGLERAMSDDALFGPCARVYAKLVDAAPDVDGAVESFASLCEAVHVRCARGRGAHFGNTVAAVCLTARCLAAVCGHAARTGAAAKRVKPAVAEFAAALAAAVTTRDRGGRGPYAVLCCADPGARWFGRVSRCAASRSAFFQCLGVGDQQLLRAVVGSLADWTAEPAAPSVRPHTSTPRPTAAVVRYACALHAANLLAEMFRYRAVRAMFPVKPSRTATPIHAVGLFELAIGYLSSAEGLRAPDAAMTRSLCKLAAAVLAYGPSRAAIDSVADRPPQSVARVLAEAVDRNPAVVDAVVDRDRLADGLFGGGNRRGRRGDDDSLIRIAVALTGRSHDGVWRLVVPADGRMSFLAEVVAAEFGPPSSSSSSSSDSNYSCDYQRRCRRSLLMANVLCTPLGTTTLTHDLANSAAVGRDGFDWYDPLQRMAFGVSCVSGAGRRRLHRTGAFESLDRFVEGRLDEAEHWLGPDDDNPRHKCVDSIVDVAYSYCGAPVEGLRILLGDSDTATGRPKLGQLLCLTYDDFDGQAVARDVIVMLWLRLIEAATYTFSSRVYLDSKLKYQETVSKLLAENRTENGTVWVDGTTELLTKLRRPPSAVPFAADGTTATDGALTVFLADVDRYSSGWLQRARAIVVHVDRISGAEAMDLIISFGRRRFDSDSAASDHFANGTLDRQLTSLTDFETTGIRLAAVRYGLSTDGASELERLYGDGDVEWRGPTTGLSFDCAICTLFAASQGSINKCAEAYAVLQRKLDDTTRWFWPQVSDGDGDSNRRAAFGHLIEGLLQREQPEVYNAFKMSGVSWWLLCSGWASDCFWGRLSGSEAYRWLCLVVLFPVDYQAFYFVCLAAAQKRRWLEAFNRDQFRHTVYQGDFEDFRLADHVNYLESLAKKYQRSLSKKLTSEFDTC